MTEKRPLISIVIPVFNESEGIHQVYEQVCRAIAGLPDPCEIIFVDDGSTDDTAALIASIAQKTTNVSGISLSRNFGHQAALTAGLDVARGDAVVTMDGDLQHPPDFIPILVEKWKQGFQVVNTVREDSGRESLLKRVSSRIYYKILNLVSEVPIQAGAADFRLLDRQVVESLRAIKEHDRFLRGLVSWVGYSSTSVRFTPGKRYAGKTKYSFVKMFRLAVDGILSFSAVPLRLLLVCGLIICLLSFVYGSYSLYVHFFTNATVPGWTSLLITILFLGGGQLIGIGLLGEYLMHIYMESKSRPLYIIRQSFGGGCERVEKN